MANVQARPFEEYLALRLREVRQAAGLRQGEVARAVRGVGLPWTQATVSSVELGRRDLSTVELIAVCGVLGVSLADLLARPGERLALPRGEVVIGEESVRVPVRRLRDAVTAGRPLPPTADARLDADDEATRKAARALGQHYSRTVTSAEVDEAARTLWEVSLSVERDARLDETLDPAATPRQRQARRGHLTRRLLDELRSGWFDLSPDARPVPDPDPFPDAVDASLGAERVRSRDAR